MRLGLPPASDAPPALVEVGGAAPPAAAEQANACLIEVFDEDGHRGYLLDLVWLSRRALLPLLHHDVPLCIRARAPLLPPLRPSPPPAAAAASPSAASRSSAAALRAWGSLPSLPPAAAAPRLPRVRAARPPPAAPPLLTRPPPLHADPLETLFPFLGDFSGASWNTQAMFARKRQRHADKVAYVGTLAKNHDFVALTDTHGLEGATVAWTCPPGCRSWFSPGTTRRGGIGIVVRESFLRQFQAVEPRWIHVVPGRAAVLQLRGHGGALDIHVVYFATGTPGLVQPRGMETEGRDNEDVKEQRRQMRLAVANATAPQRKVLSMVTGDFNWVVAAEDRLVKATAVASGQGDASEEALGRLCGGRAATTSSGSRRSPTRTHRCGAASTASTGTRRRSGSWTG